jgi:endonuclease/exonuclease/phosphatase family metal-dependent hydrolase
MMKNFIAILFAFFLRFVVSAQEPIQESLNVLSWNIYMLPGITNLSKEIGKSHKKSRAEEIAQVLNNSNYDLVIFQEAFFNPARKLLAKNIKLKYPYQYGPINPSGLSLKTNSGIFIVSKQPLKVLGTVVYEACNGADCFAKKGVALLEGEFQGKGYQILGTHLNAGGPHWIRVAQYKQMRQLMDKFLKLDIPQIICGDMNTHKESDDEYMDLLSILDVEDIETTSQQIFTTAKDRTVIDYIFLRKNTTSLKALNKKVLWINPNKLAVIEKLNGNLSDHLALSASFVW